MMTALDQTKQSYIAPKTLPTREEAEAWLLEQGRLADLVDDSPYWRHRWNAFLDDWANDGYPDYPNQKGE